MLINLQDDDLQVLIFISNHTEETFSIFFYGLLYPVVLNFIPSDIQCKLYKKSNGKNKFIVPQVHNTHN